MNCQDVKMLLMEYVSGELDSSNMARVAGHLNQCSCCHREMEREKALADTLGCLPMATVPVPTTVSCPVKQNHWWSPSRGGIAAAAVLLAVLLTNQQSNIPHATQPSGRELAMATQDVKWTLALAGRIIQSSEKDTMMDIFGSKFPTAISRSLFPTRVSKDDKRS